jgi:metallo-beta-lactamase family protein
MLGLNLTFHGGARTVTGSRFLLEANARRVLIDCGLFQGLKELRLLNWQPAPFDPHGLEAVILTHAHIDHSGYLPRLVKEGFAGPIYCTPATRELTEILLVDAAKIQEEDAEYANRKGFSKHHPALPLFTVAEAQAAIDLLHHQTIGMPFDVAGMTVTFHSAGHILGSAFVQVGFPDDPEATVVFSGDLGRYGAPLHADPQPLPACDTLVLESTYGDRAHSSQSLEEQLRGPLMEALRRRGTILIPAFAVARSQLVMLLLRRLMDSGELPALPIHLDSPMAIDVTGVYRRYLGNDELDVDDDDLFPRGVRFHRTVEQSRSLNHLRGPRIIIAASGMMTGGRVLHHLERLLPDPRNLVVLVGYQASGTRGRSLVEGAKTLRMHGKDIPVRARFVNIEGLSAHADADDLVRWVNSGTYRPKTIFLTHGELPALRSLADRLKAATFNTVVPAMGDCYERVGDRWVRSSLP